MIILHTADWHFDEATHRRPADDGISGGWHDVANALRRVVDRALELRAAGEQVAVAFAGDLNANRKPTPHTYQLVNEQLARLDEAGIPVIAEPGNHDLSSTSEANALDPLTAHRNFHLYNEPGIAYLYAHEDGVSVGRGVASAFSPQAAIVCVPWITRAQAAANVPADTDPDELLDRMGEAITAIIRGLAAQARAAAPGVPVFLLYHGSVSGAVTNDGKAVHFFKEPIVSAIDVGSMGFAGAMYGHIHKRQDIGSGNPGAIAQLYSSSIERLGFGDQGDPKGWAEWQVPADADTPATYTWGDTNAREFITITQWRPDVIAATVTSAIVRVRITEAEAAAQGVDERHIRRTLLDAGAHAVPVIEIAREQAEVQHEAADLARTDPMIALAEYLADEYPDRDQAWHLEHLQLASELIAGDVDHALQVTWADRTRPNLGIPVTTMVLDKETLPIALDIIAAHQAEHEQPLADNLTN